MPGIVSIFLGTAVVGAVGATVLPAGSVVLAPWPESSPPPPHATAKSAIAVSSTTIRRAQRRSELWRREDKAATLRGASHRTRAPVRVCPRRVGHAGQDVPAGVRRASGGGQPAVGSGR